MIIVKEIIPIKVSGRSSVLVSFNYDESLVADLKTLPTHVYHKKIQAWEFPISCLSQLLDILAVHDSVKLELLPELGSKASAELSSEEKTSFAFTPYKHQIEGIEYGLAKKKWLLLDNPGCGKTNQIIGLAEILKRRNCIDHCLVICGINSLKSNWKKEINKFSRESCIVIGEKYKRDGSVSNIPASMIERVEQLKNPIDEFFVIINIESLRSEKIINAIQNGKNKFGMIAIDEVHRCLATGKSSTQGANVLKLQADYKVAATGTMLLNNPINCWGPLSWTGNDHSTLTTFKSQYCEFGGFRDSQVIGYKNLDLLKDELEGCSLRRTKENLVDLPPKTITLELIDMSDEHKKIYEAVKNGVKEDLDRIELKPSNLLALTTRLRQATACPEIITSQSVLSTKVERAFELADDLAQSGEKVVILSNFKSPVYKLAELLAKYKPLICTGDQADADVSRSIDMFQNDSEHLILLGTHNKMGTGLTLNRASYMICIDVPWTWAAFDQSVCRIFRITNTKPIFVYVCCCRDTIDEHVWDIVNSKKDLADFVIDNIDTNSKFTDELKSILFDTRALTSNDTR